MEDAETRCTAKACAGTPHETCDAYACANVHEGCDARGGRRPAHGGGIEACESFVPPPT